MASLFQLAGVDDAASKISTAAAAWSSKAPGVPVFLAAGTLLPTETGYEYSPTSWQAGPLRVSTDSGDRTVPLPSALLPSQAWGWPNVNVSLFPHADHVGILANGQFLEWLLQLCTQL